MCTIVVLRRPDYPWPLIVAANRDEMRDRPWRPPARHWPDRPDVTAGLDVLAGGTWLALNQKGVVAAVLNRLNTLGPQAGARSRGELPLLAAGQADAEEAAAALLALDPGLYRSFNLVVADQRAGFWIKSIQGERPGGARIEMHALPEGLSMVTAYDCNDTASPRIHRYLPRFRDAAAPDPERGDWAAWRTLLASRETDEEVGPGGAMTVVTDNGFGTMSSSLIAIPTNRKGAIRPVWLFAAGRPDEVSYDRVEL